MFNKFKIYFKMINEGKDRLVGEKLLPLYY